MVVEIDGRCAHSSEFDAAAGLTAWLRRLDTPLVRLALCWLLSSQASWGSVRAELMLVCTTQPPGWSQ